MSNTDLHVALMEAGRMNLMHLPPGAIAWLWDRPKKQVDAAEALAVAANAYGNPIVDASLLKADRNIVIIKCEGGECFRIYPDGGYSCDETPMDIGGCSSVLQGTSGADCGCDMDDMGHGAESNMGAMMGEDGSEPEIITYWLDYQGKHVDAVRLPVGATEQEVKYKSMDMYQRHPRLFDASITFGMIRNSKLKEYDDSAQPALEDEAGLGGTSGMGTGSPYVGDIDMGSSEQLDDIVGTRGVSSSGIDESKFRIKDLSQYEVDMLAESLGISDIKFDF
jgi:hypothetical protein